MTPLIALCGAAAAVALLSCVVARAQPAGGGAGGAAAGARGDVPLHAVTLHPYQALQMSRNDMPLYHASQTQADENGGEMMAQMDELGASYPMADITLDDIQLANILMQGMGSPSPDFINQQYVETRRKKRSNYDNHHKHLVEITPVLHNTHNDGNTPLAIILAAPDLVDKNRKIRKKTRNKTTKTAKENINSDESHEINVKTSKLNKKNDKEATFFNVKPLGFNKNKKQYAIVSSDENNYKSKSSAESNLEHQAKVANALADALRKYKNYKLRHETDESHEVIKNFVKNNKHDINKNETFKSSEHHKHSHSSIESKLPEGNENNEIHKKRTVNGSRYLLGEDDLGDTKHLIVVEENDAKELDEVKIKESKDTSVNNEMTQNQTNEIKASRELSTKHNDDKKYFEESRETQHLINNHQHNGNHEIIYRDTKPTENEVNSKKVSHNEELYFKLAKEIEDKERGENNKQIAEDEEKPANLVTQNIQKIENNYEKSRQISDETYQQDNEQEFIIVTPLNYPANDILKKQLISKETFVKVGTYENPLDESENSSRTYFDAFDHDKSISDQETSKQGDNSNDMDLEKLNHGKQLEDLLTKKDNSADESFINESRPEKHSKYVNENSLITPSSKENLSTTLKENISALVKDISNTDDRIENSTETIAFRTLNTYGKKIPIEEEITEKDVKTASESSNSYHNPRKNKSDSTAVEDSKSDSNESNIVRTQKNNVKDSEISDSEENMLKDGNKVNNEVHFIAIDDFSQENINNLRNIYNLKSLYNKIEGEKAVLETRMQELIEKSHFNDIINNERKATALKTYNLSFVFAK